jgi:hypothetical protein
MRCTLFWEIAQRIVVIPYRRFGTTYRSHLQGSRIIDLEDGTNRVPRNVGTELPLYAAQFLRRAQVSCRSVNVFKNITVDQMTIVCICWLKL